MKRIMAVLLSLSMVFSLLSGCSSQSRNIQSEPNESSVVESVREDNSSETEAVVETDPVNTNGTTPAVAETDPADTDEASSMEDSNPAEADLLGPGEFDWEPEIKFTGMADETLLPYIEDTVYTQLVKDLDSTEYYIESVSAVYVSQEYLQEVAYNSQTNVFFGYSLAELDEYFEGTRYVFTLGEDGQTTVEPLQVVEDTTYEQILKNVAIGTGVILVCVTVSAVTAGAGAPAVSMIFAVAAKTGATCALSGTVISGVTSAVVKGYQTGDINEALKAGALGASQGYKWGAISGALAGGAGEAWGLYSATGNGLTMNEVATIQHESGYPLSIIKQFHTVEEYTVFKNAGLQAEMLGGKLALVRSDVDLYNVVDEFGRNNFTRMSQGLNPIDASGKVFQWHHIGQNNDATLALLTADEHKNGALHGFKIVSEIDRDAFNVYKKEVLNKALLKYLLASAG